jgi:ADP-ribose pyrophosphatase
VNNNHLVETKISSDIVYKGNFLHILRDTVGLPNGKQATREYVVHPGAVVVIALLDDGRVVLERQFRYPIGQVMVEFPAGNGLTPAKSTLPSPIPRKCCTSTSPKVCL